MQPPIMEIASLIIEIRPRIRSANVFIEFNNNLDSCPSIVLTKHSIEIADKQTSLGVPCDNLIIVTDSLTNVMFNKTKLNFRFTTENVLGERGCYKTELLVNAKEHFEINTCKQLLKKNTNYIIHCLNCKRALSNTVRFKRVLPLPSEGSNPNEWFCHQHTESKFDFQPKIDDVFYAISYVNIHVSNMSCIKKSGKVVVCRYCFSWLGVECDKHTLRLWHNTVNFVSNTKSIESCSLSDILQSIKIMLEQLNTCVKLIINCQSTSEKKDIVLLWVLEKKLQILFKDCNGVKSHNVAKVLFKFVKPDDPDFIQWNNNSLISDVFVSKPMFVDLLKHLHRFNKIFPEAFSKSNDFNISYLFLYDKVL